MFPALHQLMISQLAGEMEVYKDAFHVLASAATLWSLVISEGHWLHFLLPHIPPDLVSFEGNFLGTPLDTFLEFINTHAALKDLALDIYPLAKPLTHLYPTLDLDLDVLPNLRSFRGPFSLAPKFICCDKVYVYLFSYQLQKRKELTKEEGIYSSKINECTVAHISYVGVRLRYLIYD